MAIYMAIDYGLKRVGLAVSDPAATMAFPLATLDLDSYPTRKALLADIIHFAESHDANSLVIGLPQNFDGSENLTCRQVRNVTARLKRRTALPIYFMPELLSSRQAEEDLKICGLRGKKLKAVLDQQAACRILESFLNQPSHLRMLA